jgi:hypothetical protein
MAIGYVGGQIAGFAGTTSPQTINFALTGGLAAVPAAEDLVVISYCIGSTVQRFPAIRNTGAVNYTAAVAGGITVADTFDVTLLVSWRFMPSTPETQFVLTETVGGGTGNIADAGHWTCHVFRGVDLTTPMDVAAVAASAASSRVANPGSITPVTKGAWVYASGGAASGTGGVYTAPQLVDFLAGTTADTNDAQIGSGFRPWTTGALDLAAFAGGGTTTTSDSWAAITAALRPRNVMAPRASHQMFGG